MEAWFSRDFWEHTKRLLELEGKPQYLPTSSYAASVEACPDHVKSHSLLCWLTNRASGFLQLWRRPETGRRWVHTALEVRNESELSQNYLTQRWLRSGSSQKHWQGADSTGYITHLQALWQGFNKSFTLKWSESHNKTSTHVGRDD